ncbi:MAG: hypothetical protein OXE99_10170 [Cellvibrionales bacterium]|nr:hypothetical protein [Cellvibrionales bacterium]
MKILTISALLFYSFFAGYAFSAQEKISVEKVTNQIINKQERLKSIIGSYKDTGVLSDKNALAIFIQGDIQDKQNLIETAKQSQNDFCLTQLKYYIENSFTNYQSIYDKYKAKSVPSKSTIDALLKSHSLDTGTFLSGPLVACGELSNQGY